MELLLTMSSPYQAQIWLLSVISRMFSIFEKTFLPRETKPLLAKTQNHAVLDPRFEKFKIPSLIHFKDGDRDKILLCPIIALRKYLSRTEQYCSACVDLFVSATKKKKWVSQNTILFSIRLVSNHTYGSAIDVDSK